MNKLIFLSVLIWTLQAHASFSETSRRYLSPKDMFTLMSQKFPVLSDVQVVDSFDPSCWIIGSSNVNITGLVNPALSLPASTHPGAGFVRWWGSCGEKIIGLQFGQLAAKPANEKLWRRYWDQAVLDRFRDTGRPADPFHKLSSAKWTAMSEKMRGDHIRYLIEEWIGPNAVVKDLGIAKGTEELAEILKSVLGSTPGLTMQEANQKLILALVLREEFVTY